MNIFRLFLLTGLLVIVCPVFPQSGNTNPHGEIRWDCISCHTTESWQEMKQPLDFQHAETGFQLSGAHRYADCMSCHETVRFGSVASACADCHTDVHKGELGINCQSCHTLVNWDNRQDHLGEHAARGFPLTGAHAVADCQSCHLSEQLNEFSGTAIACFSCHMGNYVTTINPDHNLADFSFDCESCHQPAAINWAENVRFDHPASFALNGAHQRTDCASCHDSRFAGTPTACFSCHAQDYSTADFPDHQALGFPTDCASCHNEDAWQGAQYDHVASSAFALNGAHAVAQCTSCHVNNQLVGLPRVCVGCHEQDYIGAAEPSHVQNNFPTDCMTCHNENAWSPADFDHSLTSFPLTGAHIATLCADCHENGVFIAIPTDCYSCHQQDYEDTNDPDHAANSFSFECTDCHTTAGWDPATFNHAQTNFPLTGAHQPLDCITCHSQGYVNTPLACVSCHETDYQTIENPDHVAAGFSLQCESCHATTAWMPASWEHSQAGFELTGAHIGISCLECHSEGYSGTPIECASCHDADFQGTSNPNHIAAGFPPQCEVCHTTVAWSPANWNHDTRYFPINSGNHREAWDACVDCHVNPAIYDVFECIFCHEHNRTDTDNDHDEVANYVYESIECFTCHPTGEELMLLDRMRR